MEVFTTTAFVGYVIGGLIGARFVCEAAMKLSKDHVEFIDGFGYYKLPDSRLFRAEIAKPIGLKGDQMHR